MRWWSDTSSFENSNSKNGGRMLEYLKMQILAQSRTHKLN
jgi:hypothetical protein